jgi:hypothetical protein
MSRPLFSALFVTALAAAAAPYTDLPRAQQALSNLPARFEANRGQFHSAVKFAARANDSALAVYGDGVLFNVPGGALRMTLAGGNPAASTEGLDEMAARSNYILGSRSSRWKFGIPNYARVRARGAYPGVDMVYYFNGRSVEYDVVVAPGADPSAVRLRFSGALSTRLAPDGSLAFDLGGRQVRQLASVAYQQDGAKRRTVAVSYRLDHNGEVVFSLGDYDRRKTLVIDPVLDSSFVFAGYLQGYGYDIVKAATVDSNGALWITGWSMGLVSTLPEQNTPYQYKALGFKDVFIAKIVFDATTGQGKLAYWTYIGGMSGNEEGNAIAVGPDGKVYVVGYTTSGDYPAVGTTLIAGLTGTQDAIISVIDPALSGADSLVYSSYYGGELSDTATALALASDGTVYMAGYTDSQTIPGSDQDVVQAYNRGSWDVFIAHINPSPDTSMPLLYGTYFGGYSTDMPAGIALDSAGHVWLAGYTFSSDFPATANAYQSSAHSVGDAFLAEFDFNQTGLDGLRYCTYIGGDGMDIAHAMAIDSNGVIVMSGYTLSSDFPTTSDAFQPAAPGGVSAFLLRFDPAQISGGQPLLYSTYAGWGTAEIVNAMTLMPGNRVALAGYTMSQDFPLVGSTWWDSKIRQSDAFVAVFDPSKAGSDALLYSAVYGSSLSDTATVMVTGPNNSLYVGGTTNSSDLPVTDGSGKLDGFGLMTSFLVQVKPPLPALPQAQTTTESSSSH